jgi:transcriptional regulator with XRE-family HTH domain
MKELSFNLKRIRKIKGLTQKQLAEKVGVSSNFIANIEQGKRNPSLEVVEKISTVLRIEPKDLLSNMKEFIANIAVHYEDNQFLRGAIGAGASFALGGAGFLIDALLGLPGKKIREQRAANFAESKRVHLPTEFPATEAREVVKLASAQYSEDINRVRFKLKFGASSHTTRKQTYHVDAR